MLYNPPSVGNISRYLGDILHKIKNNTMKYNLVNVFGVGLVHENTKPRRHKDSRYLRYACRLLTNVHNTIFHTE